MAYAVVNTYEHSREARARRTLLSGELERLESRASSLTDDIMHLEDPRGVETELRRRYDVGKEGEEVIILVEDAKNDSSVEEVPHTPPTFLERIKQLLSGE